MNANLGFEPEAAVRALSNVAFRVGVDTVGILWSVHVRCDKVMDPSEFAHMITIWLFAIVVPNPIDIQVVCVAKPLVTASPVLCMTYWVSVPFETAETQTYFPHWESPVRAAALRCNPPIPA